MKPKALACLTELELRYQCHNTKYQEMVECYNVRVESTKVIELVAPKGGSWYSFMRYLGKARQSKMLYDAGDL